MPEQEAARIEHYRGVARELRQIAGKQRFDFCRHAQLVALAKGFERLAERLVHDSGKIAAD